MMWQLSKQLCVTAALAVVMISFVSEQSVVAAEQRAVSERTGQGNPGLERTTKSRAYVSSFFVEDKLDKSKLVPNGWDPALAGDVVMGRLVNTSAPQVLGAHDAEFICVGDRAYVVTEANDLKAGESAGWPFIYATMSIVNLKTLKLETIIDFAKGEQRFENETLSVGACFVPRIIQKDANTLRCYFTSEDPGKRQSQMWFRDFDLKSGEFAPTIYKAKLKTAAGTFDFQPQYFHADAATHGFKKKASDSSFFIFDSFKKFDGKTYVGLNNFSGQQNALALVHDDLETFEVIGHFNEPQTELLSESAINRLPDGTWMAICRNDKGNYHFTTSADGKMWSVGKVMPYVPNGVNSKPTFDKFGDTYYLGWQEATRIQGVTRSVFNVDISRDGKTWERKYRFETPKSFQYPSFHEHEGKIWLTVTQGDKDGSRKERIMFGKLENVGQFEPQTDQKRIEWPAPPQESAVMKRGVKLFTDRDYVIDEIPDIVRGLPFLRTSIEQLDVTVTNAGTLFALTPTFRPNAASQEVALQKAGFTKIDVPETQLFPGVINRVCLYRKDVKTGERLQFRKMVLLILKDGAQVRSADPNVSKLNMNPGTEFRKEDVHSGKNVSSDAKPEKLYNGIVLPDVWPPRVGNPKSVEPMEVPYLSKPPEVIPIDVGRQLFVDNFLIESTDMKRVFHQAEKFAGNPVFKPETAVEKHHNGVVYLGQGGVFFDPSEKLFKMFYTAGWRGPLALATSPDLKNWTRPELGLHGGNNLLPAGVAWGTGDGETAGSDNALWYDIHATDPRERIKYLTCWMHVPNEQRVRGLTHSLQVSDGVTWSKSVACNAPAADYGSIFYNPFRNKWVQSIKRDCPRGRCRFYVESDRFLDGADWSKAVYWTNADHLDQPEPAGSYAGIASEGEPPQLYSLAAVAYESLMIGMHQILRGPRNEICAQGKFPKLTDLEVGFSRDGFHWDRPDRRGLIRGTREAGTWDRAYLHTTTGVLVVLDDRLVFPYCAYSGDVGDGRHDMYGGAAIGLASLRRDGFASMEAVDKPGTLTTRTLTFMGRHLFVNVNAPQGELRAELLDLSGKVLATSKPVTGDTTKQRVEWLDQPDLAQWAGQPVRFRFQLSNGQFYSFWVTDDINGASNGYVGAGGPDFSGLRDIISSTPR
jgi:hypothetical protein